MSPADPCGPHASLERMNRFQEVEARRIIADLALPPASRGLDVGCGVGLYALWLTEAVGPGGSVLAIEPEMDKVDAARALVGHRPEGGRVEFDRGDGTAIPLPDRSVDWVWCGDVLHHILDTEKALREFRRVVRPGGWIVVKESQALSAMFLPGHPELERRIQLAEIRRTLDEGGGRSFQERRQATPASLRAAGLTPVAMRTDEAAGGEAPRPPLRAAGRTPVTMGTYMLERRSPLDPAAHDYIQQTVFARNWGDRPRDLLGGADWAGRAR